MGVTQKKSLIHFDMPEEEIEVPEKSVERLIVETNPSALADIYRKARNKNKAIQALQRKLNTMDKRVYSHELLCTYIYFGDYDGAIERAASLGFVDEQIDRLLLLIHIHKNTHGKKVACGTGSAEAVRRRALEYLSKHFHIETFELICTMLADFCRDNPDCEGKDCRESAIEIFKSRCSREYLSKLHTDSLKYIYNRFGVIEALRLFVLADPKIEELYFRKFARECSPSNEEIVSILERIHSPSLFKLAEKRGCLNNCIIELKEYYERERTGDVVFESPHCKEVQIEDRKFVMLPGMTSRKCRFE